MRPWGWRRMQCRRVWTSRSTDTREDVPETKEQQIARRRELRASTHWRVVSKKVKLRSLLQTLKAIARSLATLKRQRTLILTTTTMQVEAWVETCPTKSRFDRLGNSYSFSIMLNSEFTLLIISVIIYLSYLFGNGEDKDRRIETTDEKSSQSSGSTQSTRSNPGSRRGWLCSLQQSHKLSCTLDEPGRGKSQS